MSHGLGASCAGITACNANPDPCCGCSQGDTGGYGGAGCVNGPGYLTGTADGRDVPVTCAAELACAAKPTAACCQGPEEYNTFAAAQQACADAGFGYLVFPTGATSGTGGAGGAAPDGAADAGGD